MSRVSIHGAEHPIKKIFSDDFAFTIPLYQRHYAWTTDEAGDLLEDFIAHMGDSEDPLEEVTPYFLGSIVLIKGDEADAQVVDGQQRLTTLAILLAVLRATLQQDRAKDLTSFLYEQGNIIAKTPNRYRLTLRDRDAKFFQEYIQDEMGIEKLKALHTGIYLESQKNIKENALLFLRRLQELSEDQRFLLAQFLISHCFLVVVSTPDQESAFRIFSVLNGRGMDLSYSDILKAEIIGKISIEHQEANAAKWEKMEADLGSNAFQDLFLNIRTIYRQTRIRTNMLDEFRKHVYPERVLRFLTDLERLAASFMLLRVPRYKRSERYYRLLTAISQGENIFQYVSPLQLTSEERREVYKTLNGEVYQAHGANGVCKYILLRLDALLSEGTAMYDYPIISVEHVLPQHPSPDSEWMKWFPNREIREKYVHRLGNLALLSRSKNKDANNYDFLLKKQKYFVTTRGVTPFVLTSQVLQRDEWTPEIIERRQNDLMNRLCLHWSLLSI